MVNKEGTIFNKSQQYLVYADNIVLLTRNQEELKEQVNNYKWKQIWQD